MLLTFLLTCISLTASYAEEEPLVVRDCGKLPSARYGVGAAYDGEDSIYILGGATQSEDGEAAYDTLAEVVKFSIATGETEVVANFSTPVAFGTGITVGRDIYYFGPTFEEWGGDEGSVWKLNMADLNPVLIDFLNESLADSCVVLDDSGGIYMIGGRSTDLDDPTVSHHVSYYDLSNGKAEVVANTPFPLFQASGVFAAGMVFVFGGAFPLEGGPDFVNTRRAMQVIKLSTGATRVLPLTQMLPNIVVGASAVLVDDMAYIIGGGLEGDEQGLVIRWDTNTNSVANVPLSSTSSMVTSEHASVYVRKEASSTIYIFGGLLDGKVESDHILCIDVPVTPDDESGSARNYSTHIILQLMGVFITLHTLFCVNSWQIV